MEYLQEHQAYGFICLTAHFLSSFRDLVFLYKVDVFLLKNLQNDIYSIFFVPIDNYVKYVDRCTIVIGPQQ